VSLHPDPNFAAIPTYPVVLFLKGADVDVNTFSERIKSRPIEGMPPIDPDHVVRAFFYLSSPDSQTVVRCMPLNQLKS